MRERERRHSIKDNTILPLVQIGWDEALCGLEAQYMDMLAPTYSTSMRDGCWFCHNQGLQQLRNLYHTYPELWRKLLDIDVDSPISFTSEGHTVHDYDKRFRMEDQGLVPNDRRFKWKMMDEHSEAQISIDEILGINGDS